VNGSFEFQRERFTGALCDYSTCSQRVGAILLDALQRVVAVRTTLIEIRLLPLLGLLRGATLQQQEVERLDSILVEGELQATARVMSAAQLAAMFVEACGDSCSARRGADVSPTAAPVHDGIHTRTLEHRVMLDAGSLER